MIAGVLSMYIDDVNLCVVDNINDSVCVCERGEDVDSFNDCEKYCEGDVSEEA